MEEQAGKALADETVVGRITSVFGVKGWLKVFSYTDPAENLLSYRRWSLRLDGKRREVTVTAGKVHGKALVVHLEGVDDRELARDFCGAEIAISTDLLPELAEGEFYWYQLQGLRVETPGGVCLGSVDYLLETGANDVLVVKPTPDSLDDRERLIPYLPEQVLKRIDLDQGLLVADWDPEF